MHSEDIMNAKKGTVFLIRTENGRQESAVAEICRKAERDLAQRTVLNKNTFALYNLESDSTPNRFDSLMGLLKKLVTLAGNSSRYNGLLILDIDALAKGEGEDLYRLKALGEFLNAADGLASECTTVILGPEKEDDFLLCAEQLDSCGMLRVEPFEEEHRGFDFAEFIKLANLKFASERARSRLRKLYEALSECEAFSVESFTNSLQAYPVITAEVVQSIEKNPYSYASRIMNRAKQKEKPRTEHRIGFDMN